MGEKIMHLSMLSRGGAGGERGAGGRARGLNNSARPTGRILMLQDHSGVWTFDHGNFEYLIHKHGNDDKASFDSI